MKKLITQLFAITILGFAQAQSPAWVKFSGPANYANFDAQEVSTAVDTFNNIYTAASMYDSVNQLDKAMLVKYNEAGVEQWTQYYDNNDPVHNGSYVVKLLVDNDGNSYLAGYGVGNDSSGKDFMLIKYNASGVFQWVNYWDGGLLGYDYVTAACFDAAGNIILAGYDNDNAGAPNGDDMAVVKYSPAGTLLWSYTWNNSSKNQEDRAYAVTSDLNSNVFITGSTYQTGTYRDMITQKINADGSFGWSKIYTSTGPNDDDWGSSVAADSLGNAYVTGSAGQWVTIKYTAAGDFDWEFDYTAHDLNNDRNKKVVLDMQHNLIVAGNAFVSTAHQSDLVVSKYTQSGTFLWSTTYDSDGGNESSEIVWDTKVDSFGYIYVTGLYDGAVNVDMLTIIFSPTGQVVWHANYTNPLNTQGTDRAYSMAIDRARNIILAGFSETRGSSSGSPVDVVTLKYSAPDLPTGITDLAVNNAHMLLYPNPSNGRFTLSISNQDLMNANVVITNLLGETVAEQRLSALEQQIDLSSTAKGIYLVSVKTDKTVVSKKIILD